MRISTTLAVVAAAGLAGTAASQPAQAPVANYWMSAQTTSGFTMGGAQPSAQEMMGMMMGMNMANQMMNKNQNNNTTNNNPPPLVSFFVAVNGQKTGPFDLAALSQQVQGGTFKKESLVWKNGMAAWAQAGTVPELAELFNNMPPPLPPPIG